MPSQTPNMGLYKVNGETDGNDTFNVDVVLNDNWDKLDAALGGVETEIEGLKQSGVDGKNRLETAIIAKEGTVSKQSQVATFEELDTGIRSIPTGTDTSDATAAAGDLLAPKTAYGPNGKITGTIPVLTGIRNATGTAKWGDGALAVYPEKGYQKGGVGDGEIKVTTAQLQAAEPNLNSAHILSGRPIFGVPGGIANRSAENNHMPGLETTVWAGDRFFIRPPKGYYDGLTWVTAAVPGLTAANLRNGVSVANLVGTLVEGKRSASGTTISSGPSNEPSDWLRFESLDYWSMSHFVTVSGLSFVPRVIILQGSMPGGTNICYTFYYRDMNFRGFSNCNILIGKLASGYQPVNNYVFITTGNAYVNTGFRLPIEIAAGTITWTAIE